MELVDIWLLDIAETMKESIINNHTMYPYMSTHYPEVLVDAIEQIRRGIECGASVDLKYVQKARRLWSSHLRFCSQCMHEDKKKYGESYWHRIYQLPEIERCPKHGGWIQNTDIPIRMTRIRFFPASSYYEASQIQTREHALGKYVVQYELIASSTEWLLENGLESKEAWLTRRITDIWEEKGRRISLTDIRQEMSIKSNTYRKYGEMIDALIKQLNSENQ